MKHQAKFLLEKAIFFLSQSNYDSALIYLNQANTIEKDNPVIQRHLAACLFFKNEFIPAIKILDNLIKLQPKNYLLLINKANILQSLDQYDESIELYEKAIEIEPNCWEGWTNKGNAFTNVGNFNAAIQCHNKALKIKPENAIVHLNLAITLYGNNKHEEAIKWIDSSILLNNKNDNAWNTKGKILAEIERAEEAIKCYCEAIKLNKSNASAHENLAILYLSQGKYKQGWEEYEWRWKSINFKSKNNSNNLPLWDGKNTGKILIWAEQGIGEQILFAKYLSQLNTDDKKIYIQINNKLIKIFKRSFPTISFIDDAENIQKLELNYQVPIGSLPFVLQDNPKNLENNEPYLVPNKEQIKLYKEKLFQEGYKICGISLKSTNQRYRAYKNIEVEIILKKLSNLKLRFINLDYALSNDEIENIYNKYHVKIENIQDVDLFNDLDALLSLASACDFTITASNTCAHLIGASGLNTYLMTPNLKGKFWYWTKKLDRINWYKKTVLLSQTKDGKWDEALDFIVENLKKND